MACVSMCAIPHRHGALDGGPRNLVLACGSGSDQRADHSSSAGSAWPPRESSSWPIRCAPNPPVGHTHMAGKRAHSWREEERQPKRPGFLILQMLVEGRPPPHRPPVKCIDRAGIDRLLDLFGAVWPPGGCAGAPQEGFHQRCFQPQWAAVAKPTDGFNPPRTAFLPSEPPRSGLSPLALGPTWGRCGEGERTGSNHNSSCPQRSPPVSMLPSVVLRLFHSNLKNLPEGGRQTGAQA